MPKATDTHTISTSAPGLPDAHPAPESAAGRKVCGTTPPGLTPDPVRDGSEAVESHTTPDARLVELHAQLLRQDAVIEAITDEGRRLAPGGITPASEDQEARLGLANDVRDQIIREITATPARSAAGLHAKAQALIMVLDSGIASSADVSNDQLAFALAVDVLSGEDARLIHLCALFHQQNAFLAAVPDDDDDAADAPLDARWRTSDEIEEIQPVTMKGVQAKAKVAVVLFEEAGLARDGSTARFALAALRDAAGEAQP